MTGPFTITLVQMHGEPWEHYVIRCNDLANRVAQFGTVSSGPLTISGKANETGWGEIEAPGYSQPGEQSMSKPPERDSHFAGFAALVWERLRARGSELSVHDREGDIQVVAQAAYDLVAHTLHVAGIDEDVPFNDAMTVEEVPDIVVLPD